MRKEQSVLIQSLVMVVYAAPAIGLLTGVIAGRYLPDPAEPLMTWTGIWATFWLFLTLLVSPLSKKFRKINLLRYRRGLGLTSLAYVALHLISYLLFHVGLSVEWMIEDLTEKPYIIFGWFAAIGYMALGVTSSQRAQRLLRQRWKTLHRTIYLITALVLLHLWWQIRADILIAILAISSLLPLIVMWLLNHPLIKNLNK